MKTIRLVIKARDIKVAIGHTQHTTGSGVHKDKRTKRVRTRATAASRAIGEWS